MRRSSRVTVDMGASRSIRDVLTLNGHGNANVVHSVIVALMSLAAGQPRVANPSSQEVLNFVETYPFVTECCPEGIRKALPRSGAIMGAIEFVARLNGEEDTFAEFANVLKSGVPAYPDCAAHALRERIMRDSMARNHMALRDVHRVAVAAWEKFRRQQPAKFLRVPDEYKITGWPQ